MPADQTKRGIPKPSFLSHPLLIDYESCGFYDIILGEILPKPRPCTSQAKKPRYSMAHNRSTCIRVATLHPGTQAFEPGKWEFRVEVFIERQNQKNEVK